LHCSASVSSRLLPSPTNSHLRGYSRLKISGDNLAATLARQLGHVYLVSGDEPLLVNEATDAIRARARAAGFTERDLHIVERGFDWDALRAAGRAMSLFAERRIIEVRMATPAPGEKGAEALIELAEHAAPDNLILAITGKLDGRAQSSQWVSLFEKVGVVVQVWPIELARLSAWIQARLQRHGLQVDTASAKMIAERVEGNLLAAHGEVEKLALLLPPGPVSEETVLDAVADSARFDVLQIGDAAMRGHAARALRILEGLRAEGVEPTLVLWAINKDLQWIARAQHLMSTGHSAESAMNAVYVWRPRQTAMKLALTRLRPPSVRGLLLDAERVDRAIKGVVRVGPWPELEALVARFVGVKLSRAA
jgi:DNA polymerase III subunit delta